MSKTLYRIAATLAFTGAALYAPLAQAAPVGGQVSAGAGSIIQTGATAQAGTATTITQQSQNLAIDWNTFSVAANESVRFNQPNASAIALNRVLSSSPSQIYGSLSANGQVFILNPNGVLFGQSAQVNVGGLVATTLSLSNADFMAGNYRFSNGGATGAVVNQGALNAANGGYIALLAPEVRNEGVIIATLGTALLAAGDKVTLNLNNGSLLGYSIDQGALKALAENKQLIQADGGLVVMSAKAADALSTAVVNNTGIIEARTVQNIGGVIKLMGDMQVGKVNVGGTLDASAPNGGNGGFIETSAAHVNVATSAKITTLAVQGISGNWLIDPVDFTIAAAGGDITGATLSANLNATSVTILSTSGTTGINGDIFVNDAVNWATASTLTLNAIRNVNVNAAISNTGTGKLVLRADMNGSGTGTVNFAGSGHVTFNAGRADFYYNPSAYNTPTDYTPNVTGTYTAWMLVNNVTQLQAMNTNLAGNYALGTNFDAAVTSTWNTGAGFVPVGNNISPFTGAFDGLGHTVSNLVINRPTTTYVGLFGYTATGSTVKNVGLLGGSTSGAANTGALVGFNNGTISIGYATGNVSGTSNVGGLVGYNLAGAISDSYATGTVSGASEIGGLIGYNTGTLTNVNAGGNVSSTGNTVGGLLGFNSGIVNSSYATGNVSGGVSGNYVGGLAGTNYGSIGTLGTTYATGAVSGSTYVGGLVGINVSGTITKSYATGNVNGNNAGGLAGANSAVITLSYATGSVSGSTYLGGLVGINSSIGSSISKSYATGVVNGSSYVGGLVGYNTSTITTTYSTGSVTGASAVGGLAGFSSTSISTSFWNTTTSGQLLSAGGAGVAGRSTAQMMTASNFVGWSIASTGGTAAEWRIYDGYTYPLLASFLKPLTVTANDVTKTYDGLAFAGGNGMNYSSLGAVTNVNIFGVPIYGGTSQGAVNAGSYTITATGLYSNQQGYDITGYVNGVLTVNKVVLTITANNNYKVLNDTEPNLNASGVIYSGFVNGENPTALTGALALARAGVGAAPPAQNDPAGNYNINASGLTATNYAITYVPGVFTISPAGQLLVVMANISAAYGVNPLFAPGYAKYNNGVGVVNLLTGATNIGNAWTLNDGTSFTASSNYVSGTSNVGSYTINAGTINSTANPAILTTVTKTGALTVTPAALTVTANSVTKTYGQTITFAGTEFTFTGLQYSDTIGSVSLTSPGAAPTANVAGSPYAITASLATGGTFNPANYTISYVDGTLTVNPAALTVTANSATKTYGQTITFAGTEFASAGLQNGETIGIVSLASAGATATASVAGNLYTITASGATGGTFNPGNYTITYANGTITVNKAALTVTANNNGKVINDVEPNLLTTGVRYNGFVNGETSAVLGGTLALARTGVGAAAPTVGDPAGTYSIDASGQTSGNYNITYAPGIFTISPPGQLLIVMADRSAVYGVNPATLVFAAPVYASYSVGGVTTSILAGSTNVGNNWTLNDGVTTFTASTNYVLGGNVGSYSIGTGTPTTATSTNPNFLNNIVTTAGTLTITPRPVTLVAPVAPAKTYDGTSTLTVTGTTVGISNKLGLDVVSIAGIGAYATQNAAPGKTYTLSNLYLTGAAAGNYSLAVTTLNGTDGIINPAALTVTASAANKTYNGLAYSGGSVVYGGFVNGETAAVLGGTLNFTGGTSPGATNAGNYTITPGGQTSGNYTIIYVNGALTINPAALTITANAASKTYDGIAYFGGNGVTYTGFVNSETPAVLVGAPVTYSGTSQGAVNAGSYALTPGGLTSGNYAINYVNGILTINPAALTITANSAAKIYGQTLNFAGTEFTSLGLKGIENIGSVSLASTGTAASASVAGGPYTITASSATGGTFNPANYIVTYTNGALTVNRAALTVTASNATKTYGQALNFAGTEFTATGLQNGNSVGSVNLTSTGAAATANVAGGPYAITASAASGSNFNASNYNINYVNGALVVDPAALTVTANNVTKIYGQAMTFTGTEFTQTGLQNGETIGNVSLSSAGVSATAVTAGNPYAIIASAATGGSFDANNYIISYVDGVLAVSPASSAALALGGDKLVLAYNTAQLGIANAKTRSADDIKNIPEPLNIVNCGVLMPPDAPANTCQN